jgi:hypothetical protein
MLDVDNFDEEFTNEGEFVFFFSKENLKITK